MKKLFLISLLISCAFADIAPIQNTNAQTVAPSVTQQSVTNQPINTIQNTQHLKYKKRKPQKPKFNHNEMWCGDTHVTNQNADYLADYCKHFAYKHHTVEFRDDRSGKLVSCKIKYTGELDKSACHVI